MTGIPIGRDLDTEIHKGKDQVKMYREEAAGYKPSREARQRSRPLALTPP